MNDHDEHLERLFARQRAADAAAGVPAFDAVWGGAVRRHRRRRYGAWAAAACVAALFGAALWFAPPGRPAAVPPVASWQAPSDALLRLSRAVPGAITAPLPTDALLAPPDAD